MKLLINLFILILLLVFNLVSFAQDNGFDKAIYHVVEGFNQQDASKINALINKDIGLIFLFRRGAEVGSFEIADKIDFANPIPEYYPFTTVSTDLSKKIIYSELPVFDCDKESWSKKGIYYNDKGEDKLFTGIIKFLVKYDFIEINTTTYKKYQNIEQNSRRIVVVDNEGEALVFYLTKIGSQWYLTIIDRVSDDCSA